MTNYYYVLGLSENATADEIKVAFKKLAIKYHPDKHAGDSAMEEKFKEINEAYQVLSDPYEKTRFDLKLKYQQFSSSQETSYASTSRPPHTYRQTRTNQRPPYRRSHSKEDYRKNAIATAYAFGIAFAIGLLVMMVVWAKQSYDTQKREKLLAERRSNYLLAKEHFEKGQYQLAFDRMADMRFFGREEEDMRQFKNSMIDRILQKGSTALRNKQYSEAIVLMELAMEFDHEHKHLPIQKDLAFAYRKIGNANKALEILERFLLEEYELIGSLVAIATIHRDDLQDLPKALETLQIAHRLAVKRYKTFYGEGYALVIDQKYIPQSHYALYSNLADLYMQMSDHEMAIKAADWNKYVWPDSTAAYLTAGYSYLAMNKQYEACEEFSQAKQKGWTGALPNLCY